MESLYFGFLEVLLHLNITPQSFSVFSRARCTSKPYKLLHSYPLAKCVKKQIFEEGRLSVLLTLGLDRRQSLTGGAGSCPGPDQQLTGRQPILVVPVGSHSISSTSKSPPNQQRGKCQLQSVRYACILSTSPAPMC